MGSPLEFLKIAFNSMQKLLGNKNMDIRYGGMELATDLMRVVLAPREKEFCSPNRNFGQNFIFYVNKRKLFYSYEKKSGIPRYFALKGMGERFRMLFIALMLEGL